MSGAIRLLIPIVWITLGGCSHEPAGRRALSESSGLTFADRVNQYFQQLGYDGKVSEGLAFASTIQPAIDWARGSGNDEVGRKILDNLGNVVIQLQDWNKRTSHSQDRVESLYVFLSALRIVTQALVAHDPVRSELFGDASALLDRVASAETGYLTGRDPVKIACNKVLERGDCEIFSIKVHIALPGMARQCERLDPSNHNCKIHFNYIREHGITSSASPASLKAMKPYYGKYVQAVDLWWINAEEASIFDLFAQGNSMPSQYRQIPEAATSLSS